MAIDWNVHNNEPLDGSFGDMHDGCTFSAVWSEFCETASLCWNACWYVFLFLPCDNSPSAHPLFALSQRCVNMILQLRDPSTHPRKYIWFYHAYVWTACFAIVLAWILTGAYAPGYFAGTSTCIRCFWGICLIWEPFFIRLQGAQCASRTPTTSPMEW